MPAPVSERERRPRRDIAYGIPIPPLPQPDLPIQHPELSRFLSASDYPYALARVQLQEQATTTGNNAGGVPLSVGEPQRGIDADFAMAAHPLAKTERKAPDEIATTLAQNFNALDVLEKPRYVKSATPLKGYVNFELDMGEFGNAVIRQVETNGDDYGNINVGQGATVVIDCSSPNIAKYMSVGHLRSTVIGESLARIYKAGGYSVIRDNHLGDWGTQFGMLGRAYELWKDEIPELADNSDPVKGLYKLYVKIHEEADAEKAHGGESALEKEGRAWFKRLEEGDPQALELFRWASKQSLVEFQRVYELLGSKFEYSLGESFYVPMVPAVLETLENRGVAKRDDTGALVSPVGTGGDGKEIRLVIQKADGTSLYATRDLAALAARAAWFDPEKILYVVGGDQSEYFKQVFTTFDRLAEGEGPKAEHVGFGKVNMPDGGKMSTRKGNVIFLEDVLSEGIARARAKIDKNGGFTEEEAAELAKQVGVGAVIYMDLGQGRERNIAFDMDRALSLEGNSSPYIQYQNARAHSILRRAQEQGIQIDMGQEATFDTPQAEALVKHLAKLPDAIRKAIDGNQPSTVAEYAYSAADLFSQFYNTSRILQEGDAQKRNSMLRLVQASSQVIKNSLHLLGIQAPARM